MEVALVREDTCHHWAFLDVTVGFRMIEVKIEQFAFLCCFGLSMKYSSQTLALTIGSVITDLGDWRCFGRCSLTAGIGDN